MIFCTRKIKKTQNRWFETKVIFLDHSNSIQLISMKRLLAKLYFLITRNNNVIKAYNNFWKK